MGTYEKMARAMATEALAKGWDVKTCRIELEYCNITGPEEVLFWSLVGL